MTPMPHFWSTAILGAAALGGCAEPCVDDGLLQKDCPGGATATDSTTDSVSASATDSASASATDSASASATESASASASESDSDTAGGGHLCPGQTKLRHLITFQGNDILRVNEQTGSLQVFAAMDTTTQPQWVIVTAAHTNDGRIYGNDNVLQRLVEIDLGAHCVDGGAATMSLLADSHGRALCGIAFDVGGTLYGVDSEQDDIVTLRLSDGGIEHAASLVRAGSGQSIDVVSCAMAYDCDRDLLLFAEGGSGMVFSVDPVTGESTVLADTGLTWSPAGMEFIPEQEAVWIAGSTTFYRVAIDGSHTAEALGTFQLGSSAEPLSDLELLPLCN
jgi:hypothetical protein